MKTLVLNSGSSSIKYSLFDLNGHNLLVSGLIEKIGEESSRHRFRLHNDAGNSDNNDAGITIADHRQGLQAIFTLLSERQAIARAEELFCIGHRVVHGGEHFRQPVIIDAEVIAQIREMIPLAPLHNPARPARHRTNDRTAASSAPSGGIRYRLPSNSAAACLSLCGAGRLA
nr:hypothetical protein [Methylomarinum sp. Ch1-1]MDP4521380.1 hypothetical protein [Methylomarinum sp. Ch1-1]